MLTSWRSSNTARTSPTKTEGRCSARRCVDGMDGPPACRRLKRRFLEWSLHGETMNVNLRRLISLAGIVCASVGIAALQQTPGSSKAVQNFVPVTDQMLAAPPPGDWLSWRRTLDAQGYSPLNQITRGNVQHLELAWALTMKEGNNQATPLVHDGIMFLAHPQNTVQAIDARTGDVLWEYA